MENDEPLETTGHGSDEDDGRADCLQRPPGGKNPAVITFLRTTRGIRGEATIRPEDPREAVSIPKASVHKYTEVGEISRGGMGSIVKIVDNDIRRPVAMKIILGDDDPARLERFVEEAQITGQLEHPNIVPVHEINVDERGKTYFTMKLVRGETLESIVDRIAGGDPQMAARYSLPDLLRVFLKVCEAVSFAHARGVIHRDLKPENVMVGKFGEVLVMDWGIAKIRMKSPSTTRVRKAEAPAEAPTAEQGAEPAVSPLQASPALTQEGQVIGTPAYMPPEQAAGRVDDMTPRSDVFSLGGMLYKILTTEAPYDFGTVQEALEAAVRCDLVLPRKRSPGMRIPAEIESVCVKAMAAVPEERYESVQALMRDVQAFLDRRVVEAHSYGPVAKAVLLVQRNPAASLAAAVAAVLIFAFGAFGSVLVSAKKAADLRAREKEILAEAQSARAEAEALRAGRAENARDAAETNLVKARLVSTLLKSAEDALGHRLREVKHLPFSGLAAEERLAVQRDFWKAVEAFERTVQSDRSSTAAWLAVKGLCARHSGVRSDADEFFAKARVTDPDVAYADLFEGLAWFVEYVRMQPVPGLTVSDSGVEFEETPGETPDMAQARLRFEAFVAKAKNAGVWGNSAANDYSKVLAGFRAMHGGDLDTAETGLSLGLNLPETALFRDDIRLARAILRYQKKDFSGALRDVDEYLSLVKTNAWGWFVRGSICSAVAAESQHRGLDPVGPLRDAVDSFTRGLELDLALPDGRAQRGAAYARIGAIEADNGLDFVPTFERALDDLDKAAAADQGNCMSWVNVARARQMFGEARRTRGEPSLDLFRQSMEAATRAVEIEPANVSALLNRGIAGHRIAELMLVEGNDPKETLEGVFRDYDAILSSDPRNARALRNKAAAMSVMSKALQARNQDSRPVIMEMIRIYDSIVAVNQRDSDALYNRGVSRNDLAAAAAGVGEDPSADIALALADLDASLSIRPRNAHAQYQRGAAFDLRAVRAIQAGEDPREHLAEAAASFELALETNPRHFAAAARLGNALRVAGEYSIGRKLRAGDTIRRADKALELARELNPEHAQIAMIHGVVLELLGRHKDARTAYQKSLALKGGRDEQLLGGIKGLTSVIDGPAWNIHRAMGNAAFRRGDLDEARAHYSRAIEQAVKDKVPQDENQAPYLAETHKEVARIWALRASGRDCLGGEPGRIDSDEAATHIANALASLRMAISFGLKDPGSLAKDPGFSGLTGNEEFKKITGAGGR